MRALARSRKLEHGMDGVWLECLATLLALVCRCGYTLRLPLSGIARIMIACTRDGSASLSACVSDRRKIDWVRVYQYSTDVMVAVGAFHSPLPQRG